MRLSSTISSQATRAFEALRADGDHVAEDFDAELREKLLGHRADGDASGGFAGAGAFEDVAGVGKVVFDGAGQVGVAGAWARDGLVLRRDRPLSTGRDSVQFFQSALAMIMRDGGADGVAVTHAGDDVRRGRSRSSCGRRGQSPAAGAKVRD